jgi:predicted nucleotidyltransferase
MRLYRRENVLVDEVLAHAAEALRKAGARFAYVFGSRVAGSATERSDVDVAAFFGERTVDPVQVRAGLPGRVDLLVLDTAPLELAGRVATRGRLLFDDDPPARVAWESMTRTIWFDEQPRIEQARRDFAEGAKARARGRS